MRSGRWIQTAALALLCCLTLAAPGAAQRKPYLDASTRRAVTKVAEQWWQARPATRFDEWDRAELQTILTAARAVQLESGKLEPTIEAIWKAAKKNAPRHGGKKGKATIETPYGEAWFYVDGAGKDKGLIIGLHGGGVDAGSADSPRGTWRLKDCMGMYPQGIRLVHDTWNTVHGERFVLTMIDIAKVQYNVDPDRVYLGGFSMGGTGSWFFSGRHPDLFAATMPFAGVLMAEPRSQVASKEEVVRVQHGLLPNVRNLAMHYTIGLEDKNTMPGTYLFVWDRIQELRAADQGGYQDIFFESIPKLAHSFPPGEPKRAFASVSQKTRNAFPETLVWEYVTDPYPLPIDEDQTTRIAKNHFYWLHDASPVDRQKIRATRDGNLITIQTEGRPGGVKGLTVLLNEGMIDPEQDTVILHGDQEIYRGRPAPDLGVVFETLDWKLDRTMVFDRKVTLGASADG